MIVKAFPEHCTFSNPRLYRSGRSLVAYTSSTDVTDGTGTCMSLSEQLWNENLELRDETFNTPFIQGLKKGSLNPVAFGAYLVQDAVWCERGSLSLAHANKKVQNEADVSLRTFLLEEAEDYQRYADEMYNTWHIHDSSAIKLGAGCQAYADYKYMVADTMDVGYLITCMIPCARLFPWLGEKLQIDNPDTGDSFGPYTAWIKENMDPEYTGYKKLEQFIDRLFVNGLIDKDKAIEVYTNGMQGELGFFKSAS